MMDGIEGSSQARRSWWTRGSRPVWCLVIFWLVVNLAAILVLEQCRSIAVPDALLAGGMGVILSQLGIVALASSLRWRSWAGGYAIGVAIVVFGYFSLLFAAALTGDQVEAALVIAVFPSLFLSLTLPLIALRYARQWRMVAVGEPAQARERFALEDLFSLTAITAANLVLLRLPAVVMEDDLSTYLASVLSCCGLAFGFGLFVVPLGIRFSLGSRSFTSSAIVLSLFACGLPLTLVTIEQRVNPDANWDWQSGELISILAFSGGAIGAAYGSLFFLSRCGMSLVSSRHPPLPGNLATMGAAAENVTAENAATENVAEVHAARRRSTRWLTMTSIGLAISCSIAVACLDKWRRGIDAELQRLSVLAGDLGGEIGVRGRTVKWIRLGERATDADLGQFRDCRHVREITITSPLITDAGMASLAHFPKAQSLMMDSAQVTDRGLVALQEWHQLEVLGLSETNVTGSGLVHLGSADSLANLDLGNTPCDDAGCLALRRFKYLERLTLDGTRVTDQGLAEFAGLKDLEFLSVARTAVTGTGLSNLRQLESLVLDKTQVDDVSISNVSRLENLCSLSLDNTAITDASLEQLRRLPRLVSLWLNGAAVTGAGFRDWDGHARIQSLSLARTALDAAGVKHLKQFSPLDQLDLSDTEIGDACLADLAEMTIGWLDLTNTKVTCAGLLATGLPNVDDLSVATSQFTEAERQQLERELTAIIDFVDPEFLESISE